MTVSAAVSTAPTSLTLSGSSIGTTGSPTTITGTLDHPATVPVTVTPTAVVGATFSTPAFIGIGQISTSWTVTCATDGTVAISATTSPSLSVLSGFTYTSSSMVSTGILPSTTTLTPGVSGIVPFSIGQGFVQGAVPAGSALTGLQLDTISTWPDGSTRVGIVSGTASMTSGSPYTLPFSIGAATAGSTLATTQLKAALTQPVTVDAGTFGSAAWTGSDWDAPFASWASGPVMSSWIYRKPIGSDAHLVAWLEVRLWSTGAVEVLPWIENGYLLVAGPTNKSATYGFTMGGSSRFSAVIDLPHHCRTPLLSGTALAHWLGTDSSVVVKHDVAYLQQTELVPSYYASVSPSASIVNGQPSTFAPLQQGSYVQPMGNAGYQPSIGVLPEWDVLYLTSTAPSLWGVVQRQAFSAGRYGIHYRDEATNLPTRLLDYATLTIYGTNAVSDVGTSTTGTYCPTPTGTVPPTWDVQHHPSMGYMAALLTGRYFHVETVQFVASLHSLKDNDTTRGGNKGIIQSHSGAFSTRGAGWALRTLAQAVAISKPGTMRTEYLRQLDENIAWYAARYVSGNNPQGFVEAYTDNTPSITGTTGSGSTTTVVILGGPNIHAGNAGYDSLYNGYTLQVGGQARVVTAYNGLTGAATVASAFSVTVASVAYTIGDFIYWGKPWMNDFFNVAWGYAKALNLGVTNSASLDAFYAWNVQSVVGRFGLTGSTEFLYRDACPYLIPMAPSDAPDWTGAGPWYSNWGQIWADLQAWDVSLPDNAKVLGDGSLRGDTIGNAPPTDAGGYFANVQPALAYAVRHRAAGADAAYGRLTMAPNWATLKGNFDALPVWSIKPRTPALPSWVPSPGALAQFTVGGGTLRNNLRDVVAPYMEQYYDTGVVSEYSGTAWSVDLGSYGGLVCYGLGHSAGNSNQVFGLVPDAAGLSFVSLSVPTAWSGSTATDAITRDNNSFSTNITSLVDANWGDAFPLDGTYAPPGIHSFSSNVIIPKTKGGAANGTLFSLLVGGGGKVNIPTLGGSHQLAINSATTPASNPWSRVGSTYFGSGTGWQGPTLAAYADEQDRVYWAIGNAGANVRWFDRASGTHNVGSASGMVPGADYNTGNYIYVPARKLVLHVERYAGAVRIRYMDVNTSSPSLGGTATLSSSIPVDPFAVGKVSFWCCAVWCPDTNRLLIGKTLTAPGDLSAGGSLDQGGIYEVQIPMDLTTSWTVTRRSTTGVTNANWDMTSWGPPVYAPALKSWLLFQRALPNGHGNDSVLVYRPVGT